VTEVGAALVLQTNDQAATEMDPAVGRKVRKLAIAAVAGCLAANVPANAETVCVKYGACLDLAPFTCAQVYGSFVGEVCYLPSKSYMLIKLKTVWYPYCAVDQASVTALLNAPSVGSYYTENFRSHNGVHGPFDCRDHPIPPEYLPN
jgi:hypothetical protein